MLSISHLLELPNDALVEIMLRACEPPCTPGVAASAATCRALAAVLKSAAFWARMTERMALPRARPAEPGPPNATFVANWRAARAAWLAAVQSTRQQNSEGFELADREGQYWMWADFASLAGRLSKGWRQAGEKAPSGAQRRWELSELLCWACRLGCPFTLVCAIAVCDGSGLFAGSTKQLATPAGLAATPQAQPRAARDGSLCQLLAAACAHGEVAAVQAQRVRVIWWSLGGKDLRGYRCRDDMSSVSLTIAELARPDSCVDARTALSVLERGVVYEVRRVAIEVSSHANAAAVDVDAIARHT